MLSFIQELNNNPVYLKEKIIRERGQRKRRFPIPYWTGYASILLLPILFLVTFNKWTFNLFTDGLPITFTISCYLQILYFCYKALSSSFSLIVKEKEQRTLIGMMTTPLTPEVIMRGKFWAAFYPTVKELIVCTPLFIIIGLLSGTDPLKLAGVHVLTLVYILLITTGGLWASARARSSQNAHSRTGLILISLIIGTYIFATIMHIIVMNFTGYNSSWAISMLPLALNPFCQLTMVLQYDDMTYGVLANGGYVAGLTLFACICYFGGGLFFWKSTLKKLKFIPGEM